MYVLTRTRGQEIMIGDNVEVKVLEVRGDKVRLGFKAPPEVSIHRQEIYDAIQNENRRAGLDNQIPEGQY
jgi:carbon storage regulator